MPVPEADQDAVREPAGWLTKGPSQPETFVPSRTVDGVRACRWKAAGSVFPSVPRPPGQIGDGAAAEKPE